MIWLYLDSIIVLYRLTGDSLFDTIFSIKLFWIGNLTDGSGRVCKPWLGWDIDVESGEETIFTIWIKKISKGE